VPRFRPFCAQCTAMQFGGFFEALKGQAMRCGPVRRKQLQAGTQGDGELGPCCFVKARCAAFGIALLAFASGFQRVEKLRAERIVLRGQFYDPGFLHVAIANRAETAEKFSAGLAKSPPCQLWIDFFKYEGQRAAAPQRDAQIMNRVFVGRGKNTLALAEHPLHPIQKTFGLAGPRRKGDDRCHDYLDDAAPKPVGGSPEKGRSK